MCLSSWGTSQTTPTSTRCVPRAPREFASPTAFCLQVARIRDGIRALDETISTLQTKQAYSLQAPSESLAVEITSLSSKLSQDMSYHRSRIAGLGQQVGKDEARRGHWENLKAALQRTVEKWQRAEQSHREKVRDKIGRQMRIGESRRLSQAPQLTLMRFGAQSTPTSQTGK